MNNDDDSNNMSDEFISKIGSFMIHMEDIKLNRKLRERSNQFQSDINTAMSSFRRNNNKVDSTLIASSNSSIANAFPASPNENADLINVAEQLISFSSKKLNHMFRIK